MSSLTLFLNKYVSIVPYLYLIGKPIIGLYTPLPFTHILTQNLYKGHILYQKLRNNLYFQLYMKYTMSHNHKVFSITLCLNYFSGTQRKTLMYSKQYCIFRQILKFVYPIFNKDILSFTLKIAYTTF